MMNNQFRQFLIVLCSFLSGAWLVIALSPLWQSQGRQDWSVESGMTSKIDGVSEEGLEDTPDVSETTASTPEDLNEQTTSSWSGWELYVEPGFEAERSQSGDTISVRIAHPDSKASWKVQLKSPAVEVTAGQSRALAFEVRSNEPGELTVDWIRAKAPWSSLCPPQSVPTSAEWTQQTVSVQSSEDGIAQVSFGLAAVNGAVELRQFRYEPETGSRFGADANH